MDLGEHPGTTRHEKEGFPVHCKLLLEEVQGYLNRSTIFLVEQICTVVWELGKQ